MSKALRVLIVEDDPDDAELVLLALRREGYEPVHRRVDNDRDLRVALLQEEWDIVLCDWSIPGFGAPAALEIVKASQREIPFVIVSGTIGEETAVTAMRAGADDFLLKGRLARLSPIVERELSESADRKRRYQAERALRAREAILTAVGSAAEQLVRAPAWEDAVREILARVGPVTGAGRILIYQNRAHRGGREGVLRLAWQAEDMPPHRPEDGLRTLRWAGVIPVWNLAETGRGIGIQEGDARLSPEAREWMARHHAESLCVIPVRTGTVWWGAIMVVDAQRREWSDAEISALRVLADALGAAIERTGLIDSLRRSHAELAEAYDRTLEGWALALELRDEETAGHARRVTGMTLRLARAMGIRGEPLIHIRRGALLHDIGKMGVPDAVLLKPGPLSDEELEIMRLHPIYAYDLLRPIPYLSAALEIPYCHHERWDGSGYPRGLAGQDIPIAARIFAVVDAWDAMRSPRPYRDPLAEGTALARIRKAAGTQFDPSVVEVFLRLVDVRKRHPVAGSEEEALAASETSRQRAL